MLTHPPFPATYKGLPLRAERMTRKPQVWELFDSGRCLGEGCAVMSTFAVGPFGAQRAMHEHYWLTVELPVI